MKLGKLSNRELEKLILSKFSQKRSEVLLHPGVGFDCSAVDIGEEICVLSSDPVTSASKNIGFIAVNICCNDAAAAGAIPIGVMTTMLLPKSITKEDIESIAQDISTAADAINIDVLGGHTEITDAVNRPIISVTVVAKTQNKNLISPAGMKIGDIILMTKYAALEGSAIIASDFEKKLDFCLSFEQLQETKKLIDQISVVKEGLCAAQNSATAMHDATEGGILGAAWEMANASGLGILLEQKLIPILDNTKIMCEKLNLNPLKLISSGCMLISCNPNNIKKLQDELDKLNIKNTIIGVATQSKTMLDEQIIFEPKEDELYKLF